MRIDWSVIAVLVSIISLILIEVAQQKKTSEAWGDLSATLRDFKEFVAKEQATTAKNYEKLSTRVSKHDEILLKHEVDIALLCKGDKKDELED